MSNETRGGQEIGSRRGRTATGEVDVFELTREYRAAGDPDGSDDPAAPRQWVAEADAWAARLDEERLFVLVAEGEDLLRVAVDRMAQSFGYARKRVLHFEQGNTRDRRFEDLLKARPTCEDQLLVVNATHWNARAFLYDLWDLSGIFLSTARVTLEELRVWVLVCAQAELMDEQRLEQAPRFACASIPVLRPCVEEVALRCFAAGGTVPPERVDRICARLEAQQREGRWGKERRALYRALRFKNDLDDLERDLDEYDREGAEARCRAQAEALLEGATPLHTAALYAATFFKDPTLADFDRAVCALLSRRVERRPVPRRTIRRGGDERTVEIHEERSCAASWRNERPGVLRAAGLRATAEAGAGLGGERLVRRVGFAQRELRKAMERALVDHDPWIHHHGIEAFRDAGLLFTSDHKLREGLVGLLADLAEVDGDELFAGWLWPSLEKAVGRDTEAAARGDAIRQRSDLDRVADVLAELLRRGQRGVIDRCLDMLLELQRFEEFLRLVWRLRDEVGFHEMQWLRRLVEDSRSDSSDDAAREASPEPPPPDEAEPAPSGAERPHAVRAAAPDPGAGGDRGKVKARRPRPPGGALAPLVHGAHSVREAALEDYLLDCGVTGRDSRGIRHVLGGLFDWTQRGDHRARPFALRVLVETCNAIVEQSLEPADRLEPAPQRRRGLEQTMAALAAEDQIPSACRLIRLLFHPNQDRLVDACVERVIQAGQRHAARPYRNDGALCLGVAVGLWMFPHDVAELAAEPLADSLFVKLVDRLHEALERETRSLARGEHPRFPLRHFHQALCLAGFSVLVTGARPEAQGPDPVARLASAAAAASEPLQHKRVITYLGVIDDAFADALAALGEIARLVSPGRHDASRARLLRVRQAIRDARTHYGGHAPQNGALPVEERT